MFFIEINNWLLANYCKICGVIFISSINHSVLNWYVLIRWGKFLYMTKNKDHFKHKSCSTVKTKSGNFRSVTTSESILDDPVVVEAAKELCKIRKNDLAALLDKTILPRIQVNLLHWLQRCWCFTQTTKQRLDPQKRDHPDIPGAFILSKFLDKFLEISAVLKRRN